MSKRKVIEAMTFRVAATMLDVSVETVRKWVDAEALEEAFLPETKTKAGRFRLVTVESVERLKREREGNRG